MKKLALLLLVLPTVASAQLLNSLTFDILDYSQGVTIVSGNSIPPGAHHAGAVSDWYSFTFDIPANSTGVTIGLSGIVVPVRMVMYTYDANGQLLQSIGKLSQLTDNQHFYSLTTVAWSPNLPFPSQRPAKATFYAQAQGQSATGNQWILNYTN